MTTTSLKLSTHAMPSDQARAQVALAAGERLLALAALLSRLLTGSKTR